MNKTENRGGARAGSGAKPIDENEKKITVSFYIKKKHIAEIKPILRKIVDEINMK